MSDIAFWKKRFQELGENAVGPGNIIIPEDLEAHRTIFLEKVKPWIDQSKGPVLDFGCGVGRWVKDLPRPYLGLDLLSEHIEICQKKHIQAPSVRFDLSSSLFELKQESFQLVFTCTVLQHIINKNTREDIIRQFRNIISEEGRILSIEWSEGQRNYDWCSAVGRIEYEKYFSVKPVAEIIEYGRRHTVWFGQKKKRLSISLTPIFGKKKNNETIL